GFRSSLMRTDCKVRTRGDDGERSLAMLRVRRSARASFSSFDRSITMLRADCRASDELESWGTSGTGPSRRAEGFDDGELGTSCFVVGVICEATALALERSTR